jgi:hypothetical protein
LDFPAKIEYGSLLVRPPYRIKSAHAENARKLAWDLKGVVQPRCSDVVRYLAEKRRADFDWLFGPSSILVPVPRSHPILENGLWPAWELSNLMASSGLGRAVNPCIQRIEPISASHTRIAGQFPSLEEHRKTLSLADASPLFSDMQDLVLVDDIVTSGTTSLACALRIWERYPQATVRLFAFSRSIDHDLARWEDVVEATRGTISQSGVRATRRP